MDPGFPFAYLFKEVSEKTRVFKLNRGKCKHWGCQRDARPGRSDCETCHSRKYRLKNPTRYHFAQVRDSAAKRGIQFLLTFDEFLQFCFRTGYLERKGRELDSLTIDRIDPSKPYQFDNIRVLTWRENCFHMVEGMTQPFEPVARAIAKFADGDANRWRAYEKEARKVLEQVEILQQKEREAIAAAEAEVDNAEPF